MKNACDYVTTRIRAYKTDLNDGHTVLMFRENKNFECYLKRHDPDGSETDYKFMFGLPISENTAREAMETAIENAPMYDFLFDDAIRMIPAIPFFHADLLLHQCDGCGDVIDAGDKFCPHCGRPLEWNLMQIVSNHDSND